MRLRTNQDLRSLTSHSYVRPGGATVAGLSPLVSSLKRSSILPCSLSVRVDEKSVDVPMSDVLEGTTIS